MAEQAIPVEQGIPQEHPPLSPVERVKDAVVGFLKSRLPGEKTKRTMEIVDKLTSHLPPQRQELAAKLRPIVEKGLYAGNVVGTYAEAVLVASLALGGAGVVKEALRPMPDSNKRKGLGGVLKDINIKAVPSSLWHAIMKKPPSIEKPVVTQPKQTIQTDAHTDLQTKEALIAQFHRELGNPPKDTPYWKLDSYFRTHDIRQFGDPWPRTGEQLFAFPYFLHNGSAAKAFIDDANAAWRAENGALGELRAKKTDFAILLGSIFDDRIMGLFFQSRSDDTFRRIGQIPLFIADGKFQEAHQRLQTSVREICKNVFGKQVQDKSDHWQDGEWFLPIWEKLGYPGLLRREHWLKLQEGLQKKQS